MGFSSLEWSKRLQEAGLDQAKAEAHASLMEAFVNDHAVTREVLQAELKALKYEIVLAMGGMLTAAITIIVALIKLI